MYADNKSHSFSDKHEWLLRREYFQEIISVYPGLNTSLFASTLNNQLDVHCSWKPGPGYTYVDAFLFLLFWIYTFQSDSKVCAKKFTRQGTGNTTDPCVANTDVVPTCSATAIQPTMDLQTISKPAMPGPLQRATPTMQEPAFDGLPFIGNTFTQQNLSPDITNILMASWRTGTQNLCGKMAGILC